VAAVLSGRRPELPLPASRPEAGEPGCIVAEERASLASCPPELAHILRSCWAQREHRRPTAAQLHATLREVLREMRGRCCRGGRAHAPP
jgi:hypothetical protein